MEPMLDARLSIAALESARTLEAVKAVYQRQLEDAFRALPWYGSTALPSWLEQCLPLVEQAQEQAQGIASQGVDAQLLMLFGYGYQPVHVQPGTVTGVNVRGVPLADVYARALHPVWKQAGISRDQVPAGVNQGVARLRAMFDVDMTRVADLTCREKVTRVKAVKAFRRVPRGGGTCALCMLAATQLYKKSSLRPIHPGCRCGVAIVNDARAHSRLSKTQLAAIHSEVERHTGSHDLSGRGIDYRRLVAVRDHGEMGPTLTWREHRFTGETDLR